MRNYRDGGEAVLEAFRRLGIDYVVCSPGSEWSPLWEAFSRQKLDDKAGPRYLNCNHETLAINVATGYTTVTRKPQAVLVHAGAGLLQGAMGIQGAQFAGLPMLILSGESTTYGEDPEFDPGFQWQASLSVVGGPHRFVEPLVKWASQATSRFTLYETVIRAGEMAQRIPAGPVYIDAPFETMLEEWTPPAQPREVPRFERPEAPDAKITEVADLIAAARNPVILVESAGREADGFQALVKFAESYALPVVDVGHVADYANFPTSHPLHQGFDVTPMIQSADLILLVRAKMPWHPPSSRPADAKVVSIDENPLKSYMVYQPLQADIYVEGDMVSSLNRLTDALTGFGKSDAVSSRLVRLTDASTKRAAATAAKETDARGKTPIDPISLCVALRETMPDDAVYVDETTTHRGLIQRHVGWSRPQSYFYVHGGLGQGIGMALGVKLALPDQPVVSLIGDGAFMYNPTNAALGLARDSATPILIVVFNNGHYAAMRNNQRRFYPDGAGFAADQFHGGEVQGFDYAELAKLFDGYGERIEDPAELHAALARGLLVVRDGRSAIINVILDR